MPHWLTAPAPALAGGKDLQASSSATMPTIDPWTRLKIQRLQN